MRASSAIGLGLALLVAGRLFGTAALFPAGIALLVIPLVSVAWVSLAVSGLRLRRSVPGAPVIEGRGYALELALEGGLLPPPGGSLTDPLLDRTLVIRRRSHRWEETVVFARRGRRALGTAEALVHDSFWLGARRRRSAAGGEIVVLPRVEPLRFTAGGAGADALGFGERGRGGAGPDSWAAEFEIDGLRAYREGTPASRIHWPTVARTGELQERRITAGADAARLVVIDPLGAADEASLDAAVRAAASICVALAPGGGCALLLGGEPRPLEIDSQLRGWPQAHHRLALLAAEAGGPAIGRIGRAGIVFWVSADPSAGAARRCRGLPASRSLLVRPATQIPAGPVLFRVAGCEAAELRAPRGARAEVAA
jgi:uncharacterized protein (DUF58 family)